MIPGSEYFKLSLEKPKKKFSFDTEHLVTSTRASKDPDGSIRFIVRTSLEIETEVSLIKKSQFVSLMIMNWEKILRKSRKNKDLVEDIEAGWEDCFGVSLQLREETEIRSFE